MSHTDQLEPVRVVIVDDHALFRQAVCRILSKEARISVIGVADCGESGIAYARDRQPQIVVTDVRMPGMRGAEVTRAIREEAPDVQVIGLSVSEEQEDLLDLLRAGARGYVVKSMAQTELTPAILSVSCGESWLSPKIAGKLIAEFTRLPSSIVREALKDHASLTPREQSVLSRLSQGMTNREIAEALGIGETTAKTHLRNILEKLHARNRLEAASLALKLGLVARSDETDR